MRPSVVHDRQGRLRYLAGSPTGVQIPRGRPSGRRKARPRSEIDKRGVVSALASCGCDHIGIDLVGSQRCKQGQLRNGPLTGGQLGDGIIDPAATETDVSSTHGQPRVHQFPYL